MSRFGGKGVKVSHSRAEIDELDFHEESAKPVSRKDNGSKVKPAKESKKPATEPDDTPEEVVSSPTVRCTGGGLILPDSVATARKIQSVTIETQLRKAFVKNGDSQLFLGAGALRSLWIGIPMWASSAWDSDPIPGNLAMEWVAGATGMPIGVTITLAGGWGTTKSTFAMEVLRWIERYGGFGHYIDHESKISPNLPPSILGDSVERIMTRRAKSVEGWQSICSEAIAAAIHTMTTPVKIPETKMVKGKKKEVLVTRKLGRSVLLGLAVDTISGKLAKANQEKTMEKGHGDRSHPLEALINTNFFKTLPNVLEQYPVLMVLVSQTKFSTDSQGLEVKKKAGGQQVQFIESFDLELKKISKTRTANYDVKRIKIRNEKNAFGHDHRYIDVDVLSWEELDPTVKQGWSLRTIYDWNTAAVQLLASKQMEGRFKRNLAKAGWHLAGDNLTSGVSGRAYSKTLGMTKNDKVSLRELGDMLHRNPEVLSRIRKALRIQEIEYMDGDILKQRERIRAEFEKDHPNHLAKLVAEHTKEALVKEEEAAKKKKKQDAEKAESAQ